MPPSNTVTETASPPDFDFRFAFGVYGGVLTACGLALAGSASGGPSAGFLYMLGIGGFVTGMIVGWVAAGYWRGGPERIGGSVLRGEFLLPAVVLFALGAAGTRLGSPVLVFFGLLSGSAALLTGGLVMTMARTRYVAARFAEEDASAVWRAETAPRAKRRRFALAAVVFCLPLIGAAVGISLGIDLAKNLPALAGIGAAAVGSTIRSQTFRAHALGLEIRTPVGRRFIPWHRFDGYRLTESELRLRRPFSVDYRCDRDTIEDVDAVVTVLDRHLDAV